MKVLVTGASGTIGGAVARALVERGHQVVGVVTGPGRAVPEGVESLVADLFEPGALAVGEVDGVVHAASSNDERAADLDHNVVDSVLKDFAGTDKPFVYTSGLWLHGDTDLATEESPFAPPLVVSWRPEVERRLAESGVRTIRIRPGLVYGGGRGYIPVLLAPQDGVIRHFGDGGNHWSVVHADDLGDLYVRALESAAGGSVYLGVNEEPVRVRDVAAAFAARHGAEVQAWDPADAAQHWGVMVEAFMLDQAATAAKARAELGWRPRRPGLLD